MLRPRLIPRGLTRRDLSLGVPLVLGFALTGVVTTMLGPLLPSLASDGGLQDTAAGALFAAQFFGQTLGAVASALRTRFSLVGGYALIAVGVAALGMGAPAVRPLAIFLYGLGLGLVLPATNLLVGRRSVEGRGAALAVLNFLWGLGAVLCPVLVAALERHGLHARVLLLFVSACSALVCMGLAWAVATPPTVLPRANDPSRSLGPEHGGRWTLAAFAWLFFLYVGAENCIGGWIATYAHRLAVMPAASATLVAAWFWGALLAGRMAAPWMLRHTTEARLRCGSLLVSLGGMALLLAAGSYQALVAGVLVSGLGLACMFPLTVSLLCERMPSNRAVGLVFSLCSCGGAIMPWLMGVVSLRAGSIRWGFVVPLLGMLFFLLLLGAPGVAGLRSAPPRVTGRPLELAAASE